ncbi:ferredoxin--NADP+ reductase [Desulfitispora alkaliphila]|uniref:sulfide/dihydroorotate dehydrogenase-like FAD/NAD-binding protein n=1 Tax=Desulfitispora alkaliphila TaxID=622674 RepID=UPI003D2292C0
MFEIVKKQVLSPSIKLFEVKAPRVAQKAEPGQFFMLRVDEKGERIPLTIANFDREAGTITTIVQEIGHTSQRMGNMEEGQEFLDVAGPLGEATEIKNYGTVMCVGGGLGIAPVYPIARALKEAGNEVISVIGARNKDLLYWEDEMDAISSELHAATDDGSFGHKGFVTDIVKQVLENKKVDAIWAIGPMPMMRAVAETTRPFGVKTIVSLNPIMVDGTGMCGACRVEVGGETKFACVDGPEFDGHLVDFDLALRRLAMYKDDEKRALASGSCGRDDSCQK